MLVTDVSAVVSVFVSVCEVLDFVSFPASVVSVVSTSRDSDSEAMLSPYTVPVSYTHLMIVAIRLASA